MGLYKILGVSEDATSEEIVRAYKKRCMTVHPDRGGGAEEFKELNEAYSILSNPELRAEYDETGGATLDFDLRAQATTTLAKLINQAVDEVDLDRFDLYDILKRKLDLDIAAEQKKIEIFSKKIGRHEKAIKKTIKSKKATKVIELHEGIVKYQKGLIKDCEIWIQIFQATKGLLDGVEFEQAPVGAIGVAW
jgi:DnaJ-class molecular chaperone